MRYLYISEKLIGETIYNSLVNLEQVFSIRAYRKDNDDVAFSIQACDGQESYLYKNSQIVEANTNCPITYKHLVDIGVKCEMEGG